MSSFTKYISNQSSIILAPYVGPKVGKNFNRSNLVILTRNGLIVSRPWQYQLCCTNTDTTQKNTQLINLSLMASWQKRCLHCSDDNPLISGELLGMFKLNLYIIRNYQFYVIHYDQCDLLWQVWVISSSQSIYIIIGQWRSPSICSRLALYFSTKRLEC